METAVVASRLADVRTRISQAARQVGRDPDQVRLVVVTKGHPISAIQPVIMAGASCLGENYVEEAVEKIAAYHSPGLEWHMIGHVQSRKARQVCVSFHWVHSLDSLKLARRYSQFCGELGRSLPVLLECNVSGEESKFGFPAWDETYWEDLANEISPILDLPHLQVRGLMTMAPFFDDPEDARPIFRRLRGLQTFLLDRFPQANWQELSMGMSGDYEVAVQEGATLVRIGTAIMGPRPQKL